MAIGSESSGGAQDITFRSIRTTSSNPINIKSRRGRGGVVQNVLFEDIESTSVSSTVLGVDLWYFCGPCADCANCTVPTAPKFTPVVKNVTFRNINARLLHTSAQLPVAKFNGLPESMIHDIVMDNVKVVMANGSAASWGGGACVNAIGKAVGGTFPVPPCFTQ